MSRIAVPATVAATPAAAQPLLAGVQQQLRQRAQPVPPRRHQPGDLEGYLGLAGGLGKGRLDVATRQRIAIAVAERNGCGYCLSAHTYLGRNLAKLDDAGC